MKKFSKLTALLLALVMALSLTVTAGAEETTAAANDLEGSIVILHTNDVHGAIAGYAKAAALKDDYEARGAYVLLVDAGDFIQGEAVVSASQGAAAMELMSLAGYDLAAPGNHEFDYGYENLSKLAKDAKFPIVAANVLYNGKVAFEASKVFTAPDGTKIGFFGLDTPETATKAHPAKIKGVTFLAGQEMFDCAQKQVDALKAEGCKYIICLGHLGIDDESVGNRSIDLLEKVSGIDFFIDGHSHSTMEDISAMAPNNQVGDAYLTSTGTKLKNVGAITIASDGACTVKSISVEGLTASDTAVADRAAAIQKEIDDAYGAKFAVTAVDLNGEKAPGNRTQETNLGDLITDALVWGANEAGTKVDAAITNGGGIRASIAKGDITKKDINTVLPFGNTLSIVQVTGAELLEALEASTYCTPEAIGGFPQVSGMRFTVDTDKAFDAGDLYPRSTYHKPAGINRVTIQSVGGKDFDEKATYTIATNDFMAAGGDTYYAFSAATVNYDLGVAMDEVLMNYITEAQKGTIGETYAQPQGRITVQGLPFTDVAKDAWYFDGVKYAYDNSIFAGTTATTFAPAATMTRGQMVTVLWRMAGSPASAAENPFTDVSADSAYAKAIVWAYENKITSGYTETTFAPGKAITREQFATILYNYAKFMKCDVAVDEGASLEAFSDAASVGSFAQEALTWANAEGLVNGKTATTIAPKDTAPRSQVAVILMRFCNNVVPAETAA